MKRIIHIYIIAIFVFGSLFLFSTQKVMAGFAQIPICCQSVDGCADNQELPPDAAIACLEDTLQENAFCNEDTGQCEPIPRKGVRNIPTLSEWGLIAMASILGIAGFIVIRRKKVTA